MLRTIIIDDEPRSIQNLKLLLERYCKQVEVIGTADFPEDGIVLIREHKPDLVFLDIEMPVMNGFDMLKQVGDVSFKVIFITAYNEYDYAVKALRNAALDYLLKPFNIEELISAVAKAEIKDENISLENHTTPAKPEINSILYNQLIQKQKLALPTLSGIELIVLEDIVYVKPDNTYSILHLEDNTNKIISKPIKLFEEQLHHKGFFRIHRDCIINLNYIKSYIRGRGGSVVMTNGKELEVASNRKDEFLALLEKYWGSL